MKLALDPAELRDVVLAVLAESEVQAALRHALQHPSTEVHALTTSAFAVRWSVSRRLVAQWLTEGLPVVRIGRLVRIPIAQADAWVASAAAAANAGGAP